MDYKLNAIYNNKHKIDEHSEMFYVKHMDLIYEYEILRNPNILEYNKNGVTTYLFGKTLANVKNTILMNDKQKSATENALVLKLHDTKISIYKNGKKQKTYLSDKTIIDNNGLFLIRSGNKKYVLWIEKSEETDIFSTKTAFVVGNDEILDNLIYYTEEGVIFYIFEETENSELKAIEEKEEKVLLGFKKEDGIKHEKIIDQNEQKIRNPTSNDKLNKEMCNCYQCIHSLPDNHTHLEGYLVINKQGIVKVFNKENKPIFSMDDIFIYSENVIIKDVISVKHFILNESSDANTEYNFMRVNKTNKEPSKKLTFFIALTLNGVYVFHNNIYVFMKCRGYIRIVPERLVIHNYIHEIDISGLVVLHSMFMKNNKEMFNAKNMINLKSERMVCKVVTHEIYENKVPEDFYNNFIKSCSTEILCKAYKMVDEKCKKEIYRLLCDRHTCLRKNSKISEKMQSISINLSNNKMLSAYSLFLLVTYNYHIYKLFIDQCIFENKLHYIHEYYMYLVKLDNYKEVEGYLLSKEIIFSNNLFCTKENNLKTQEEKEIFQSISIIQEKEVDACAVHDDINKSL
ncbi:hypothetical protein EHP00_724 [Ecytonucleospora hepatopenaei]|uniref:Uncharacterized protein n=1 Tax=Ecytonucleospora hepatopenaei TaxID=646526 RepID=A0A1W0E7Z9_9MICR|nr:hypothetical protein EHP00_724 [Ecytonucleospora hepatopenaei]